MPKIKTADGTQLYYEEVGQGFQTGLRSIRLVRLQLEASLVEGLAFRDMEHFVPVDREMDEDEVVLFRYGDPPFHHRLFVLLGRRDPRCGKVDRVIPVRGGVGSVRGRFLLWRGRCAEEDHQTEDRIHDVSSTSWLKKVRGAALPEFSFYRGTP